MNRNEYQHTAPPMVIHPPQPADRERRAFLLAPPLSTPSRARDGVAQDRVVRVTHAYEYRITDEKELLYAAAARGWEPAAASDRGDEDPRDLLGAVMALTAATALAGARTVEHQSSGELLGTDEADGPTDRSSAPASPRVTRLPCARDRTRPSGTVPTPDFATLFATRDRRGRREDEECGGRERQLTPRTAHLLHTALVVLADQAYDDARYLGDRFLRDAGSGAVEVLDRLPPFTWTAGRRWRRRMARAFDDLADDLAGGRRPAPACIAEEMALYLAIQDAPAHQEELGPEEDHHRLQVCEDDYSSARLLPQDHDVLMLFHTDFAGSRDLDRLANQYTGADELSQAAWFIPFDDLGGRDPLRGFRR
ncbi:hypothetical protein [Streptomyces virginiae]|uniref:hypothetical protein n=1 Tax=Streptomyces virginiae TaxID=1961 RepID=UPI00345494B2